MDQEPFDYDARPAAPAALRFERGVYRKKDRAAILWFCAALGLYLLGNGDHSLWDRDEPRYAEATRAMLEGGDWIVPMFNGEIRYDKPPLIYWLSSVSMRLFGVNEFSARAVSALAGAAATALVFLLAMRLGCSMRGASVAAVSFMTSALVVLVSKAATTDAVLLAGIVGALLLHWQQRLRFSWGRHLGFWGVVGLTALVKGPVGPVVVGLTVATWRVWRWLSDRGYLASAEAPGHENLEFSEMPHLSTQSESMKHFTGERFARTTAGLALFLLVAGPWVAAVWIRTDGDFLFGEEGAITKHVVARSSGAMEGHGGDGWKFLPFLFFYVPVFLVGALPSTPLALAGGRWIFARLPRPEARFLVSWFVPNFVLFSLVATKLPHYVVPLIPCASLAAGLWWTAYQQAGTAEAVGPGRVWRSAGAWFVWIGAAVAIAALPALAFADRVSESLDLPGEIYAAAAPPLIVLAVAGILGGAAWHGDRPGWGIAAWGLGTSAALVAGMVWTLPMLEPLRPSKAAMEWIRANAPPDAELMAAEFREPSLVFYARRQVKMWGNSEQDEAIDRLKDFSRPAALVSSAKRWRKWRERYEGGEIPKGIDVRFERKCFDFQGGEPLDLVIVGNW